MLRLTARTTVAGVCHHARMTESPTATRLSPGDQAPDFTLPDADGNPVRAVEGATT